MADITHSTMPTAKVHEPKHITTAVTGDNGKIITPSGSSDGVSVLESLDITDVVAGGVSTAGKNVVTTAIGGLAIADDPGATFGGAHYHGGAVTTTISSSTVYVALNTAGMSSTVLNGVTESGGRLTAVGAGSYILTMSVGFQLAGGTNEEIEFDFAVDGSVIGHGQRRLVGSSSDIGSLGNMVLHTLAANEVVDVYVRNNTGTQNVEHLTFELNMIRLSL